MPCPTCQRPLVTETEQTNQLCADCVTKVAARPTSDPRPRVPCRACRHTQLLRTQLFDQDGEFATKRAGVAIAEPRIDRSPWSGEVKSIRSSNDSMGQLVVYVCRGCGLTELYTDGFADLPIGPQYGSELIDVGTGAQGAYR